MTRKEKGMEGLIPAFERLGKAINGSLDTLLYGSDGFRTVDKPTKIVGSEVLIDIHTMRSLKSSNWRNAIKRRR